MWDPTPQPDAPQNPQAFRAATRAKTAINCSVPQTQRPHRLVPGDQCLFRLLLLFHIPSWRPRCPH